MHCNRPGCRNYDDAQQGKPRQNQKLLPTFFPEEVRHNTDCRDGKCQKTFRKERTAAHDAGEKQKPPLLLAGTVLINGEEKECRRRSQEKSQDRVKDRNRTEHEDQRKGQIDRRGEQGVPAVEITQGKEKYQKRAAERRKHSRQAQGKGILPEQFHGTRPEPVSHRRFLEITDSVQGRRYPVIGGDHLPRDLGITRFVGSISGRPPIGRMKNNAVMAAMIRIHFFCIKHLSGKRNVIPSERASLPVRGFLLLQWRRAAGTPYPRAADRPAR